MSDINLSATELRALRAALHGDLSDPVELMRSAGIDVSTFFEFGCWRGVDFTKSDLAGVSFRGSDMRGAQLGAEQINQVLKSKPLYPPDEQDGILEPKVGYQREGVAPRTYDVGQSLISGSVPWVERLASSDPEGASYAFGDCVVFVQAELGKFYDDDEISISYDDKAECNTSSLSRIIESYAPKQIGDNLPHYFIKRIRRSTSDFSGIEIDLGISWYRDVRAIHAALLDDPHQPIEESRDTSDLVDFLLSLNPLNFSDCDLPTQLSVNAAIILNPPNEEPSLVLARRGSEHQVGYYPRAWCVSFQETLSSSRMETSTPDLSIGSGIRRGLIEEFLGEPVEGTEVGVLCFHIEAQIMNHSSVAFAKVPLSFDDLCNRKRHIASDAAENSLIVRVPFASDVLISMLESAVFPGEAFAQYIEADPLADDLAWKTEESWHPTSRLAIYMILRRFFPDEARKWFLNRIKKRS